MLGEYRGEVEVEDNIDDYNERIGLQRQGAGYSDKVSSANQATPYRATTGNASDNKGWWDWRADSCRYPRCLVIPRGEEGDSFADRKVRHPLRLGGLDVGVQLERRTERHDTVGGTDIKDVDGVTRMMLRDA